MKLQNKQIEVNVEVRGLKITGSPITASKLDSIRQRHTTLKGKGDDRRFYTDHLGISKDTFCQMVTDWGDAQDADGRKLTCNEKNKLDVFEHDPDFVTEVITAITEAVKERRDAATKN